MFPWKLSQMIEPGIELPSGWQDWIAEQKARVPARIDALLGYPAFKRRYLKSAGYPLNLAEPATIGDKAAWRKINDRNPDFPILADKLRVRDFVAERLGQAAASALFPKLYQVIGRASDLDLAGLPGDLVIKANHASGWIIILREGSPVDADWVRRVCRHWLRRSYAPQKQEWAYRRIPRRVLVEELLLDPRGRIPDDVKFHMYDGICRRCTVETGRDAAVKWCHYTPDWALYDRANTNAAAKGKLAPERPRPAQFEAMLEIAEKLSRGLDYLRVDFLDLGERFVMTELTVYPGSGMGGQDFERDVELAKFWHNPRWPAAAS